MVQPDPRVVFRIQSTNSLTCIELLNESHSDEKGFMKIKLRPWKETAYQYWQFEYGENTSRYVIRNVADRNRCLCYDNSTKTLCAGNASNTGFGSIFVSHGYGEYRLSVAAPSETQQFYASRDRDDISVARPSNDDDGRKWHLVPVAKPILPPPQGYLKTCRIRSFDGKSLLTMAEQSTRIYVRSQLDDSPYQRWKMHFHDHFYYFENEGSGLYLGCKGSPEVGVGLVGLDRPYLLDINYLSLGCSLHAEKATFLSIGVADYVVRDKNEVCFVPRDDQTPSQLWFLETGHSIGKKKVHAKREVEEGQYLVRSLRDSATYMNVFSRPHRLVPGSAATHKFKLKYIDAESACFKLTYVTNSKETEEQIVAVISDDIVEYIGTNRKGTEFVLLEMDKGDLGYVMCLPESGHPLRVVSGRTTTDNNKNDVFSIDNQVVGDLVQMWMLVPA